ncbi:MAG: FAD-dependent oxidoreductase [Dermatophilaceae bacterium]
MCCACCPSTPPRSLGCSGSPTPLPGGTREGARRRSRLSGLSAACYLAGQGYDVTVLERETEPGGGAGSLRLDGYLFDTGPVVMTMPELLSTRTRSRRWPPTRRRHLSDALRHVTLAPSPPTR